MRTKAWYTLKTSACFTLELHWLHPTGEWKIDLDEVTEGRAEGRNGGRMGGRTERRNGGREEGRKQGIEKGGRTERGRKGGRNE